MESQREFEERELFSKKKLRKYLEPTGYEAFRVSPRTTTRYGRKYKRVYGATVSPDYSRGTQGRYGAKVEWFPHGFTTPNVKSGTRMMQNLSSYPVDKSEAVMKLMLHGKKRKSR